MDMDCIIINCIIIHAKSLCAWLGNSYFQAQPQMRVLNCWSESCWLLSDYRRKYFEQAFRLFNLLP